MRACVRACMSLEALNVTYIYKLFKTLTIPIGLSIVVCTDFSSKKPHMHVGVVRYSDASRRGGGGILGSIMFSKPAQNGKKRSRFKCLL